MRGAGQLIKLKDDMHAKWFELQQLKRKTTDGQYALMPKRLYEQIVALGHEALEEIKTRSSMPNRESWINTLEQLVHEVELKGWTSDEVRLGAPPKPYYVMEPDKAQTAIVTDINRLVNTVHRAGMETVRTHGAYCGCNIGFENKDLSSINTGALRYCEGTLRLGEKRGTILEPGDTVEHHPGAVQQHAAVLKFVPTENGYDMSIGYTESGDSNWRKRQDGVLDFITSKGGSCQSSELSARCEIKDVTEEDIVDIALMVSQLKDIDLLPWDCIPLAFDLTKEQAGSLKEAHPTEDIWNASWTTAGEMGEVAECRGDARRDRDERDEKEQLYDRLNDSISTRRRNAKAKINVTAKVPCTCHAYDKLDSAENDINNLQLDCTQILENTNRDYDWCRDLESEMREELKAAAATLVKRCPPEPIILGVEAGSYKGQVPFEISQIENVCILAGAKKCLEITNQVRARKAAGIESYEFPMGVEYSVSTPLFPELASRARWKYPLKPHPTVKGVQAELKSTEQIAKSVDRNTKEIEAVHAQLQTDIAHSKEDPCDDHVYYRLASARGGPDDIKIDCEKIQSFPGQSYGWCFDLAEKDRKELEAAAKELVSRCPPGPIHKNGLSWDKYNVELVCDMAGAMGILEGV